MVNVQQKVSGCFRSEAFAQALSRIRGYVPTLRKQGMPLLSALQASTAEILTNQGVVFLLNKAVVILLIRPTPAQLETSDRLPKVSAPDDD